MAFNSTFKPRKKSMRDAYADKLRKTGATGFKPRTAIKSRPKPQTGSQPQSARKAGLKRTPLRKVSSGRAIANRVYSDKRRVFMMANPMCEVKTAHCSIHATDVHHRLGREGKNFLDMATWTSTCRECHTWIHQHPNQARELGLLR